MREGGGARARGKRTDPRTPPVARGAPSQGRDTAVPSEGHSGEDKGQQRPTSSRRGKMRTRCAPLGTSQSPVRRPV